MLILQDPTNEQGPYLLESLTEAFQSATQINGIFAYASGSGIQLLTEDEAFQRIAKTGKVDLIVGTDAITTVRALDTLANVARQYPKMTARAFLNPLTDRIFHPKFCFTKRPKGGCLVVGSGNLTEGGLLGNWEAYSVEELSDGSFAKMQSLWNEWTEKHDERLLSLDNPQVRERVAANSVLAREGDLPTLVAGRIRAGRHPVAAAAAAARAKVGKRAKRKVAAVAGVVATEPEPEDIQLIPNDATVLIAEIPQSGNRWKQANFDLDNYRNFFGAKPDAANRLVIFRHVNADGSVADYERNRPPVTVKSRNFRFELAAASGIPYPKKGRPIGVFIRMVGRTFFYRLLLPKDPEYATVSAILGQVAGPLRREDSMRRGRTTVERLRKEWPNSPFWQLPDTA